jgi:hypothetical protein
MFSFSKNVGNCFPACNSSTAATVGGPDLCKLTKCIDELADLVKTLVITDLTEIVPVLDDILRIVNAFFKDPMAGFANMAEIINDVHKLGGVFNTTITETRYILDDVNDIISASIDLITKLISPHS